MYSLQNYDLLLETSLKSAARLLTLFEKNSEIIYNRHRVHWETGVYDHRFPVTNVVLCFNKALYIQDKTAISLLAEFLDNMDLNTKEVLAGYFKEQFPYLQLYSCNLAEKVAKIYDFSEHGKKREQYRQ